MPQKSGFFDTTADDPREYPAREFAEYFSRFVGNGIFGGGEKLKVTASGKDMNVSVNLGYGWINGYMYAVYDTPLVLPIEQATTQDRIDRIVLRLDVSTPVRAIRAIVLQGLPAATPQAPAIVRSGDIYDLSLAQVLVKANTSTIQPHQVTDERLNTQVCGVVTALINQADTTSIFNEFQSWLRTKTAEYQKQWDDFLKGVQDEGFATTEYVNDALANHKFDASAINSGTLAAARLPSATTGAKGIVQLSDSLYSTSTQQAATANAVKQVYDEMMLVKQSVVDGKGLVAEVINGKGGGPVSANSTFPELAAGVNRISTGGMLDYSNGVRYTTQNEKWEVWMATVPAFKHSMSFRTNEKSTGYETGSLMETWYGLSYLQFFVVDSNNKELRIFSVSADSSRAEYLYIQSIEVNWDNAVEPMVMFYRTGQYNSDYHKNIIYLPPDFNRNGPIRFMFRITHSTTQNPSEFRSLVSLRGRFLYV